MIQAAKGQRKSFRNKYLALTVTLLLFLHSAIAQIYNKPNTTYGTKINRVAPDTILHVPAITDTLPHTTYTTLPQIRVFNGSLWFYDGIFWKNISGAGGGMPGSGTLTNFSSGNLSPLFTVGITNPTTTPAQAFTLTNAGAYTVFGRAASVGAPSYLTSLDSNWIPLLHSEAYYNTKYASKIHSHTFSAITDGPTAVRNLFSGGTGISYNAITGVIAATGGGGAGVWGTITGTLSDQGDLQASLDLKLNVTDSTIYYPYASNPLSYISSTGSYSNPSWINTLAWSKITGTPTTIAGYGITDAQPFITPSNTVKQYWNGYKNFVTLNSDSLNEGSTNLFYTAARKQIILDSLTAIRNKIVSDSSVLRTAINLKVNISDTASMLANYQTAINQRLKISDTASMLSPYFREVGFSLAKSGQTVRFDSSTGFHTQPYNDLRYLQKSDSTIYYSKYRSDTSRTNIYNAIAGITTVGENGDTTISGKIGLGGTLKRNTSINGHGLYNITIDSLAYYYILGRSASKTGYLYVDGSSSEITAQNGVDTRATFVGISNNSSVTDGAWIDHVAPGSNATSQVRFYKNNITFSSSRYAPAADSFINVIYKGLSILSGTPDYIAVFQGDSLKKYAYTAPSTALTSTQVAYGSGSNTVTSESDLTYNATTNFLWLGGGTGLGRMQIDNSSVFTGLIVNSTTGYGGQFTSDGDRALEAITTNGNTAPVFETNAGLNGGSSQLVTVNNVIRSINSSSVGAGYGMINRFRYQGHDIADTQRTIGEFINKLTTPTAYSEVSSFTWRLINGGTMADKMILSGNGAFKLSNYGSGTFTGTPATYPAFDASGNIIESATPYGGGTSALTQYRLAVGDASNLLSTGAAITGNRALISDANGVPTHSSVTNTELGFVSGVTSAIQTQIDSKATSTPRYTAYTTSVATDANLTVAPGTAYSLSAATLSTNRTIDVTALNTNGDYIEIDNQEAGFTWSFTGATVYDAYENSVTTLTANTRYILRRSNGKIKIIN